MNRNNYFEVIEASPQWDDRQIAVHVRNYEKADPNTKQDALRKLLNPQERMLCELTTFHDPDYTAQITEGGRYRSFINCLTETPDNEMNMSPNLTYYLYRKVTVHPDFIDIPVTFDKILHEIRSDVWVLHSLALIFERYAEHCRETGKTDSMMKMIEKSVSCWVEIFGRGDFLQETYTWRKFAGTSKEEICLQVWKNFIRRIPESSYEQFREQLTMNRVKPACVYLNIIKRLTSFGELGTAANTVLDRMISDLIREADAIFFRGKVKTGYTGDYEGVFSYLHGLYDAVGNMERLLLFEAGKEDSYLFELRTTKSFETSYYHVPAIKELEKRLNSVKPMSAQPFNIENEIKNLYDRIQDLAVESINDSKYRLAAALMRTLTGDRKIKVGNEYKSVSEVIYLCEQMAIQTGDYWSPRGSSPGPSKPVYTPKPAVPPPGGYKPGPKPVAGNKKNNIGCIVWTIIIAIVLVLIIRSCGKGKNRESAATPTPAVTTARFEPTYTAMATDSPVKHSSAEKPTQGEAAASAPVFNGNENVELSVFYELVLQQRVDGIKAILEESKRINPLFSFEEITTDSYDLAEKLAIFNASESMPDIVFSNHKNIISGISQENFENIFMDITEFNLFSGIYEPITDSISVGGRKYGIPMEAYSFGILYNKGVFERFGLPIPETAKELEAICFILENNGIRPYANNFHDRYVNRLLVLDTELAQCLYQHPELRSDMDAGGFKPSSYTVIRDSIGRYVEKVRYSANDPEKTDMYDSFSLIADGTSAMMVFYHTCAVDILNCNIDADIGFFANPVSDEESGGFIFVDTEICAMASVQSKSKEACLKFLQFVASEEGQLAYCRENPYGIPVRKISGIDFQPVVTDIIGYLEKDRAFNVNLSQYGILSFPGVSEAIGNMENIGDLNAANLLQLLDSAGR